MKKYLLLLFAATCLTAATQAQTKAKDTKVKTAHAKMKVKHEKTVGNRIHNAVHPNRKEYSGVKVKREVKKS